MRLIIGIDIGGTKTAISFANADNRNDFHIVEKYKEKTFTEDFGAAVDRFIEIIRHVLSSHHDWELMAIGISCGGPLDSEKGLILAPPNLPMWDGVDIYTPLQAAFHVPVYMENDANAGALAEWRHGAGKGTRNMIFLTFGTGMGAGLILDGKLYRGSNGMAGEVGHIKLTPTGPYGYGKHGSFEGFCSGGGIANLGKMTAAGALEEKRQMSFCKSRDEIEDITCEKIGNALESGDRVAGEIFETVSEKLGQGLAILIDILNPEVIVIGSVYARLEKYMKDTVMENIRKEALPVSAGCCEIKSAQLGEMIGDYAALTVGVMAYENFYRKKVV